MDIQIAFIHAFELRVSVLFSFKTFLRLKLLLICCALAGYELLIFLILGHEDLKLGPYCLTVQCILLSPSKQVCKFTSGPANNPVDNTSICCYLICGRWEDSELLFMIKHWKNWNFSAWELEFQGTMIFIIKNPEGFSSQRRIKLIFSWLWFVKRQTGVNGGEL